MQIFKNKFHTWEYKTIYIVDPNEVPPIIDKLPTDNLLGLDIETAKDRNFLTHRQAGLCPLLSKIRLIQIYDESIQTVYVFDLAKVGVDLLSSIFKKGKFVAHYGIFEAKHLTHAGYPNMNINCSMLMSQLVDGAEHSPFEPSEEDEEEEAPRKKTGHSLAAVTERLFGVRVDKVNQVSDWGKLVLDASQIQYAGLDAVLTYHAAMLLSKKIKAYKMEKSYRLLKDMQHVVAHMELKGIPVDWTYHADLIKDWKEKWDLAEKKCDPFFGEINLNSSKQMGIWLEEKSKFGPKLLVKWPRTSKGAYSFTRTTLGAFLHLPAIEALLEFKKYGKLVSTYGESLAEKKHSVTGRLHGSYTLGSTRTGRLSSRDPNIQNFPRDKDFRNMFVAPPGYVLVVSDFSSIELRLQAEFSKDPVMLRAYKEGTDLYKTMASFLFGVNTDKVTKEQRFVGKTVMLASAYGMGPTRLGMYALNNGIKHPASFWEKAHKTYHRNFSVYSKWCDRIRERAAKLGYIETLFGKRRKLEDSEMYTAAPNTVIQGSAAELNMVASLKCYQKMSMGVELILNVHDEIGLLCKKTYGLEVSKHLSSSMNAAMLELFPNTVSHEVAEAAFGSRWGDVKGEL